MGSGALHSFLLYEVFFMFDFVNVLVEFLKLDIVPYMFGAVLIYGAFQLAFKMIYD